MMYMSGLALPTSFLAKSYNEASVANCEDNLATIFPIEIIIEMHVFPIF
jgi:hypothetical protein